MEQHVRKQHVLDDRHSSKSRILKRNGPSFAHQDLWRIPKIDGTRRHNFSILDFTRKTALNRWLWIYRRNQKGNLHSLELCASTRQRCSPEHALLRKQRRRWRHSCILWPIRNRQDHAYQRIRNRRLIGDDEHGWTDSGVFNFEGGCYAKCIDLTEEKEPQIWKAIKFGALLENIETHEGTSIVDFESSEKTENTRVSYPYPSHRQYSSAINGRQSKEYISS